MADLLVLFIISPAHAMSLRLFPCWIPCQIGTWGNYGTSDPNRSGCVSSSAPCSASVSAWRAWTCSHNCEHWYSNNYVQELHGRPSGFALLSPLNLLAQRAKYFFIWLSQNSSSCMAECNRLEHTGFLVNGRGKFRGASRLTVWRQGSALSSHKHFLLEDKEAYEAFLAGIILR